MKIVLLLAVVVGSWVGLNIYNDQELFANPFAEKSASEKLMDTAKSGIDETSEYLQEKGGELVDQTKELAVDAVEKGSEVVVEAKETVVQNYNEVTGTEAPDTNN